MKIQDSTLFDTQVTRAPQGCVNCPPFFQVWWKPVANYIIKFSDITAIQFSDDRFRYRYVCISEVEVLINEERAEQVTIQKYL